ncbi:MAG: hypothetical protein MUF45_10260 [Spirosomaceae bacterium]|jgi:hypothetical protein|nr:hypothetical protein [Spirosomataceae bacterium]
MKNLLMLISIFGILTSCSVSDDVNPSGNMVISGSWKIKSFIDNNNRDRTSNYTSYTFDFKTSGELAVSKGSTQFKGTYASMMDSGKEKFNILISTSDNTLAEINEDWILAEKSDSILRLTKSSGGNGGTKTLIFSK